MLHIARGFSLPLDTVTQAAGILAKRRAGKSYLGRRITEQMLKAVQQVVIVDPKGDWWGIRSSADGKTPGFPVIILGGEHGDVRRGRKKRRAQRKRGVVHMTPADFMKAARCPESLRAEKLAPGRSKSALSQWTLNSLSSSLRVRISRRFSGGSASAIFTIAKRARSSWRIRIASSSRHLPIWLSARGRVLVTGLGLGCVVRGLLASTCVTHVDCIEIDRYICLVVGEEFPGRSPRKDIQRRCSEVRSARLSVGLRLA